MYTSEAGSVIVTSKDIVNLLGVVGHDHPQYILDPMSWIRHLHKRNQHAQRPVVRIGMSG